MYNYADEMDDDAPKGCPSCGDPVPDGDLWPTGDSGTGESVCDRCYQSTHGGTGVRTEALSFDKFMDDMAVRRRRTPAQPDTPLRRRAAMHQERPLGRIRYGSGR